MGLVGSPVDPASSPDGYRCRAGTAVEVAAVEPIDENLCLSDVSAQRGCFQPHRACSAVPAGDILAFHTAQPGGHLAQLTA
jgi:hypothetical protein